MSGREARVGRRRRALSTAAGALGVIVLIALAVTGVARGSGVESEPLPRSESIVIVSVPGLRWQDLDAVGVPTLEALLDATALMSVRSIGVDTSVGEGYLTIGAGNRIDAPEVTFVVSTRAEGSLERHCLSASVLDAAARSADDALAGAEAGALGRALSRGGVETSVWGRPEAVAALMDEGGCVDSYSSELPFAVSEGVSLVEVGDLTTTARASDRRVELEKIESRLASLDVPDDATVLVVAPSAVGDAAEVTVGAVRAAGSGVASGRGLVSATTRRADYVTLPDIAPTILTSLGLETSDSMNGTAIRVAVNDRRDESPAAESTLDGRIAHLADVADRVAFRDRAVGPVSVVLVVLAVCLGVAGMFRRARVARMLAPVVMAYPTLSFLLGATAYHRLPLDAVVAGLLFGSVVLAALSVSGASRWGASAPVTLLAALLWVVLVVDVVLGARLQINTPLGYTPTIAGRFQGFGNLAFGLVAASALIVAVVSTLRSSGVARRSGIRLERRLLSIDAAWAVWVCLVTTVAIAAPAFGSDIGGTLAFVPAGTVLVASLFDVRLGWRRVALTLAAGAGVVLAVAWMDRRRPEDRRTHAGRFLDDLLTGDGWLVVRRKLSSNVDILVSSIWSILFAAVICVLLAALWIRRDRVLCKLASRPVVRAFLAGWATVAALGFALNDSGIAVPAIMAVVGGSWAVSAMFPVVRRAGR